MPAQQVKSITIRSGERVNGVGLVMTDFWRDDHTLYHGGYGGDNETLSLSAGEHVTEIEAHWDEYRSHTRIFYIKFTTDKGNKIEGGTPFWTRPTLKGDRARRLPARWLCRLCRQGARHGSGHLGGPEILVDFEHVCFDIAASHFISDK